jgi:hypothetical protein
MHPDVEWWYAQNALIFARGQPGLREKLAPVAEPMPCVHPRSYLLQVAQIQELAAALSEATASALLAPPAPADAAERALLEAKGSAAQNGLGPATLNALALYDRERNKVYALSTEVTRLRGETNDLHARLNALEAEVGRRSSTWELELARACAEADEACATGDRRLNYMARNSAIAGSCASWQAVGPPPRGRVGARGAARSRRR